MSLLQQPLETNLVPITLPSDLLQMVLSDLQPVVHVMLQQVLQHMTTHTTWEPEHCMFQWATLSAQHLL